jgi:hypothetical protein
MPEIGKSGLTRAGAARKLAPPLLYPFFLVFLRVFLSGLRFILCETNGGTMMVTAWPRRIPRAEDSETVLVPFENEALILLTVRPFSAKLHVQVRATERRAQACRRARPEADEAGRMAAVWLDHQTNVSRDRIKVGAVNLKHADILREDERPSGGDLIGHLLECRA